jgi:hypothetical protein
MVNVARQFNVSDVAVAKACRRNKIPLPGRGYWARVAVGEFHRIRIEAGSS